MAEAKVKPAFTARAGGVKVTVWANKDDKGSVFHKTDIARSYKDKGGEWKETPQLNTADVPKAILLLQQAYAYQVQQAKGDE